MLKMRCGCDYEEGDHWILRVGVEVEEEALIMS